VEFPPGQDWLAQLAEEATVVGCGGDGTIAAVARVLAGTPHRYGILAQGTFNNFARSLNLPTDLEAAIRVVKTGRPRPCTLGKAGSEEFLEAAAVGGFGDAIAFGEAAKDLHYGEALAKLRELAAQTEFEYRLSGDLELTGKSRSILVANTPSIGALIPLGKKTPEEPSLELIIKGDRRRVRRVRIETDPPVSVHADTADAGTTPVEIETLAGGLHVILPA
jgi:diacylglycerol kinase family enzyme